MEKLFRLYRDPSEGEAGADEPTSIHEAIMKSGEEPAKEAVPEEKETPKPKFAWGDEDRRKAKVDPSDEDEFDMGYEREVDGKKAPARFKLKEIKETAKWLHENTTLINSALGMREQLTKNPDLAKVFNTWWGKAFEGNKYNPEAVAKMSAALEGKVEQVKEGIDDKTDDIKEMETELSELDEDSPQAKILRRNINALKSTRGQLKEALDTLKTLQEKTAGHDKFKTDFETTQKTNKEQEEAKEAAKIFDDTFGPLAKQHTFDDTDDAKEFENSVRDMVANMAAQDKIKDDSQFIKAIQECAKAVSERIGKRNERIVNGYLKKKGTPPPKEEGKKETQQEEPKSIGQMVADAMFPNA